MIIGIGCDFVDHQVTETLQWNSDIDGLGRIFSKGEINIYKANPNVRFLAGRFAAKEAVVKCLGSGMEDGIALNQIEILQGNNGNPRVELGGKIKKYSDKLNINAWHVSITHSASHSMAVVIAESKEKSKQ